MVNKNIRFLIVGLGLMGGSIAYKLSNEGYYVGAITLNQEDIDYAIKHKIIASGTTKLDKDYISSFQVVFIALYPSVFVSWLKENQGLFAKGTLISDVTGVKGAVVDEVQSFLRKDLEYIPSHPMAGREVGGVRNALSSLFDGANFIITPTKKNSKESVEFLKEIGGIFNFKNISVLSIEEHDEMIGFVSQLTHCIAISLMTTKNDPQGLVKYTGDSFRDLTRIAKINEDMWCELFLYNKEKLLKEIDLFMEQMNKLKEAIKNDDSEEIKEMMRLSTRNRSYFDKGGNK